MIINKIIYKNKLFKIHYRNIFKAKRLKIQILTTKIKLILNKLVLINKKQQDKH